MGPVRRSVAAPSLAALIAVPLVSAVHAQQPPPAAEPEGSEQVVVTAQKRAQALQDVPFSVAAPNETQLRNAGVDSIVDLARNVTGLSIADLGPGQSQVAIRGISSGQVIRDQPGVKEQVGIYLDESPISVELFTPDLVLYDIDRFEVLRGPQGTLFGAGSESGTLRYITKAPRLGVSESNVEATGEEVAGGNLGATVRGMTNIPLGPDTALRAVVYTDRQPGFINAIQPGGKVNSNVNVSDRNGGRLALLWKATEDLTLEPRVVLQDLSTHGFPRVDLYNILANPYMTTQPAVTIGEREQYTQQPEGLNDQFQLGDLKADYDLGSSALTSITSYTHRKVTVRRDATQLTGSVSVDLSGGGSTGAATTPADVRLSSPLFDRTELDVFSQEMRLASTGKGPVEWLGGGFFQHVGRHYGQQLPTPGYDAFLTRLGYPTEASDPAANQAPPDMPFYSDLHYNFRQYAFFGEGTWHVTDQWSGTAGLRYYNFDEERTQHFGGLFGCCSSNGGTVSSNGVSPRAILSYSPTQDLRFDAQAARGFRLGGINDPINKALCSAQDLVTFGGYKNWKDEKAWNYELDGKMQFLDRKLTLNTAAFYTVIKDLQATVTAGTCSSRLVINVPAHSHGLEAELTARPNQTWDFSLSATWVNAELTSSVTSTDLSGHTTIVGGLQQGNRLPTAPRLQAIAGIGYNRPLEAGRDFFSVLTLQYVGSSFSQFENEAPNFGVIGGCGPACGAARLINFGGVNVSTITFDPKLPSYSLGNFRAGVKTKSWEFAGFINNMWDKTARLALDYERGRSARVGYLTNVPRTVGVTGRYSF